MCVLPNNIVHQKFYLFLWFWLFAITIITLFYQLYRSTINSDHRLRTHMEFVKNLTPPDFQAKNFTLSISSNFNSFSDKNTKK